MAQENKPKVVVPESRQEQCMTRDVFREEYDRQFNAVNHPSHYASGGIECIDAMEAAYGIEAVMHFCMCNAFKYQWRFNKKNGVEDLKKAQWYQNKYMELKSKLEARAHFTDGNNK